MLGELVTSIVGSLIASRLETAISRLVFGDDELANRVEAALDRAVARFLKDHPFEEGGAYHSISLRESNVDAVLQTMFLRSNDLQVADLDLEHLEGGQAADAQVLCNLIHEEMGKDRVLEAIDSTRKHHAISQRTLEILEALEPVLTGLIGQKISPFTDHQPPAVLPEGCSSPSDPQSAAGAGVTGQIWEEAGKTLSRGPDFLMSYEWLDEQWIALRVQWLDGSFMYAEVDIDGNCRRLEPRFGLGAYRVNLVECVITSKFEEKVGPGLRRSTYVLADGRTIQKTVDAEGQLVDFRGANATFDAVSRQIIVSPR